MSYTFSHLIYNHNLSAVKSLVFLMRNHANKATRCESNKWHLTWYADRIEVTFEEEPDWSFFNATFLAHNLDSLAYKDLVPNAKMLRDKERGSPEASEVMELIQAKMILDRERGLTTAREVIEGIPAYLRQQR